MGTDFEYRFDGTLSYQQPHRRCVIGVESGDIYTRKVEYVCCILCFTEPEDIASHILRHYPNAAKARHFMVENISEEHPIGTICHRGCFNNEIHEFDPSYYLLFSVDNGWIFQDFCEPPPFHLLSNDERMRGVAV